MKQERYTAKQYNQTIVLSETKDQITLAGLLDQIKYDGRPLRWIHCPNESKRSVVSGANLKRAGMKKGFPDILIFDSPPAYPLMKGAALELKKLKGGRVFPEQQDWLDYFNLNSWVVGAAKGLDEALAFLRDWGYIK